MWPSWQNFNHVMKTQMSNKINTMSHSYMSWEWFAFSEPFYIYTEHIEMGTLKEFLNDLQSSRVDPSRYLGELLRFSKEVSSALVYLKSAEVNILNVNKLFDNLTCFKVGCLIFISLSWIFSYLQSINMIITTNSNQDKQVVKPQEMTENTPYQI